MFFRAPAGAVIILIVSLSFCAFSHANNSELESRLSESALVITEMMEAPDASIPQDLLKRSKAIVIFPSVIKVGLGFGGQYGKGVALRKNNSSSKWGPPVFFSLFGASVGWQMGVQATDLILLVMSEVSLKGLFKDKFTLGVDASVAAGPLGRDASAATDIELTASIFSYSRAKGLFMGVAITGAIIKLDWESNEIYYGSNVSIIDTFFGGEGQLSPAGVKLVNALNRIPKSK